MATTSLDLAFGQRLDELARCTDNGRSIFRGARAQAASVSTDNIHDEMSSSFCVAVRGLGRRVSDSQSQYEIHGQVEEAFRALDEAGINWLLFRGEERMQKPTGDIDVLIASRDLEMTDKVLATLGFSRQGSALLVTRRAYVAYVPEDNLWLRIDLVTRVAFGELLEFDTSAAGAFLAAKRRLGVLFLPERNDAFWHLLLHYMLDRGDIPLPWREILHERAKDAHAGGPLAACLDALPGDATSRQVLAAVQAADWSSLQVLFSDIRKAWLSSQSPTS